MKQSFCPICGNVALDGHITCGSYTCNEGEQRRKRADAYAAKKMAAMRQTKTLVAPKHAPGPMENGGDGCHARSTNGGLCPGVAWANWLNGLGPDEAVFGSTKHTNGEVRENYLRTSQHLKRA